MSWFYIIPILILLQWSFKKMNIVSSTYKDLAVKYGTLYKVDPALIMAIIQQESGGNPVSIGLSGEIGLMQITPIALQDVMDKSGLSYKQYQLFDPDINIQVGSYFISYLVRYYDGSYFNALKAYNGGITGTKNNPSLSVKYAGEVIEKYNNFKMEFLV